MIKIINDVNGKKYELVHSDEGCKGCSLRKQCKHWTEAPQWHTKLLCLKLDGIWKKVKDEIKQAVAEPLRNCDVGTAEEQTKRFHEFCNTYKNGCTNCSLLEKKGHCQFNWGRLPYKEVKK